MSCIGPSRESQGVGPSAKPGEEVALCVFGKIGRADIGDTPFVYIAVGNVFCFDEIAHPLRNVGVYLVVIGRFDHWSQPLPMEPMSSCDTKSFQCTMPRCGQ